MSNVKEICQNHLKNMAIIFKRIERKSKRKNDRKVAYLGRIGYNFKRKFWGWKL